MRQIFKNIESFAQILLKQAMKGTNLFNTQKRTKNGVFGHLKGNPDVFLVWTERRRGGGQTHSYNLDWILYFVPEL